MIFVLAQTWQPKYVGIGVGKRPERRSYWYVG